MFFSSQDRSEKERYEKLLKILWSLSNLFSDSNTPYLYYRGAERAFCKAFNALDHSRGDTAIDAGKNGIGIGLKTFLAWNGKTFQKVAEFNQESKNFRAIEDPIELVHEIAKLRNDRLDFAKRIHGVDSLIYHCVTRKTWTFSLSEEIMDYVDVGKIRKVVDKWNTIHFHDWIHQYNFSKTKSTLLKQFELSSIYNFKVDILKNPFEYLEDNFGKDEADRLKEEVFSPSSPTITASVVLPLYSERGWVHVPERSGLNGWNADGRVRKLREVYIAIPTWIYSVRPWFFPDYQTPFDLVLPNWQILSAKVSSWAKATPKALYSNPNAKLGEWLLGEVLHIPEGELVTMDTLKRVWVDSVELSKIGDTRFAIDFKKFGSYDDFRTSVMGEGDDWEED